MSFRLKTVLGIALIEAVLLLVLVLTSLYELRRTAEEQLQQRAHTTATLFATATADAVLATDLATLESLVQEALRNPGVVYARVRDNERVLAEAGPQVATRAEFVADSRFDLIDDGVFDAAAAIVIADHAYGAVELGLDVGHLQQELTRATRNFSGIAASELLLSALFSLALGTLLTNQLRTLIAGTRAIGAGDFGHQVPVRGNDEIADASRAFNNMSSRLARLMDENAQQRDALQLTSDELRGLLDNLHSAVLMLDMQGRILHVNSTFGRMFAPRHPTAEAGEFDPVAAVACHLADDGTGRERLRRIAERAEPVHDQLFETADGRHVEIDYVPLRVQGAQYAHLWHYRDVTERILAQREVIDRGRRLDTIFELSPDGFVYFDEAGRVTSVNPAFTEMTGVEMAQAGGVERHRFFVMLRTHCGITDIDDSEGFRLIRTSLPRPRILSCYERTLHDERGAKGAHVMYFRDITTERELGEVKNEFLVTAAQELRTPLETVDEAAVELLSAGRDPAACQALTERIHEQSGHMLTMLTDLLDLARIEARVGKGFEIRRQPLLPLLKDAFEEFALLGQGRHLRIDMPETLPAVPVDAGRLRQLLDAVLDNASRYSPPGGEVRVSAVADRAAVTVTIADDGVGMTQEQVASVFKRFSRGDTVVAPAGSGLGMSLVKEIAEAHGWRVTVDSEPGVGTRVALEIPLPDTQLRKAG